MRTPVRIAAVALMVNLALSLALMFPFGHGGLALATSIAALLNGGLLLVALLRAGVYRPAPGWRLLLLRAGAANLMMALLLWWLAGDARTWLDADAPGQVLRLALIIIAGAGAYGATLLLLGLRLRHVREPELDRAARPYAAAEGAAGDHGAL
jgi:putative peptidoglycan lipid II flippase